LEEKGGGFDPGGEGGATGELASTDEKKNLFGRAWKKKQGTSKEKGKDTFTRRQ